MEWDLFVKFVEDTFPFLKDKFVRDRYGNSDYIHPLITQSAFLAYKTINQNQSHSNRLIILLPNKFTIPHWVTSMVMLKVLKANYEEHQTHQVKFKKGQKLLFAGKCVVEYDSHDVINGKRYIKVKCSKDSYWNLLENKELSFKRINTSRRLSSIEKVQRTFHECPDLVSPIDLLLDIRTLGNNTFFSDHILNISPIGRSKVFVECNILNGNKIRFNSQKVG